jgi:hypothetical protein
MHLTFVVALLPLAATLSPPAIDQAPSGSAFRVSSAEPVPSTSRRTSASTAAR